MALQRARDGDGERGDVGEESREREPRIQGHDEGGLERAKGAARGVDVGRLDSELLTGCSASSVPCECQQGTRHIRTCNTEVLHQIILGMCHLL